MVRRHRASRNRHALTDATSCDDCQRLATLIMPAVVAVVPTVARHAWAAVGALAPELPRRESPELA